MRKFIITTAILLTISACGKKEEEQSTTITTPDGKTVKITGGQDGDNDSGTITMEGTEGKGSFTFGENAANAKMPMGLPVYPGAKIMSVMSGAGEGKNGSIVSMLSTDNADAISTFYKAEAEKRGLTVETSGLKLGNMAAFSAKSADGLSMVLSARPGGPNGETHAMLIVEQK